MTAWTVDDIPDLTGRTAVVTGANSGIGFESALALAGAGAEVVLACRDQTKGTDALDRIRRALPAATVVLEPLDLADLSSVTAFAEGFGAGHVGLDILVNNAGVMALPRRQTADGFEMQFGTNHLGHFALTGRLLDRLLARPGARVVTVTSAVAQMGRMHFDDLQGSSRYGKWSAYAQAKLANQLFTLELDRRSVASGTDLVSVGAHPGYAATNLQAVGPRMSGSGVMERLTAWGNTLIAQSPADGALPSLYAATDPAVAGGRCYGPDRLFAMRGHPKQVSFVRAARDPAAARRLWDVSEELTGVRFGALDTAG
ncbi:MAG: oxidoreductase [Acidimicrobiales bacterium]|jgi:NAD(P)-dependent dehydrogenase (short-subunit alcohol dehydrogenase family)